MRLRYSLGIIALLTFATACGQSSSPTSPDAPACSFVVSPRTQLVSPLGGSFSASVTATSSTCAWTVAADVPWISILAASAGTNGSIVYDVQENNSENARAGGVIVGLGSTATTMTVTQSGR